MKLQFLFRASHDPDSLLSRPTGESGLDFCRWPFVLFSVFLNFISSFSLVMIPLLLLKNICHRNRHFWHYEVSINSFSFLPCKIETEIIVLDRLFSIEFDQHSPNNRHREPCLSVPDRKNLHFRLFEAPKHEVSAQLWWKGRLIWRFRIRFNRKSIDSALSHRSGLHSWNCSFSKIFTVFLSKISICRKSWSCGWWIFNRFPVNFGDFQRNLIIWSHLL